MGALIWLASYPKSGNTWMRAYLHNLLRNPPKPASINELDQFCLGESSAGWYSQLGGKPNTEMTAQEIMALRPRVHQEFTKVHPDSVFVKTHNMLGEWHDTPLHNMDVTVAGVYIVRNPLDVVLSMTSHFGVGLDEAVDRLALPGATTQNSAEHVPEYHSDWSTHVRSWTQNPNPQLHFVRYEDLQKKPFKSFAGVAKFLGLNPPKERIMKAIKFASFKELKKQESQEGFKERSDHAPSFFRKGEVGGWRKQLSEAQIEKICRDHTEQMARFNYLPPEWKHLAQSDAKKSA